MQFPPCLDRQKVWPNPAQLTDYVKPQAALPWDAMTVCASKITANVSWRFFHLAASVCVCALVCVSEEVDWVTRKYWGEQLDFYERNSISSCHIIIIERLVGANPLREETEKECAP